MLVNSHQLGTRRRHTATGRQPHDCLLSGVIRCSADQNQGCFITHRAARQDNLSPPSNNPPQPPGAFIWVQDDMFLLVIRCVFNRPVANGPL